MENILIFGTGGFSKDVHFLLDYINEHKRSYNIIGFLDDNTDQPEFINGIPYLGTIEYLDKMKSRCSLIIAVGNSDVVKKVVSRAQLNNCIDFPNIIHPSPIIDYKYSQLGKGNIVNAGCIISRNASLGNFNILNNDTSIGHDVLIGSFNNFSPKVQISGGVIIGDENFFGLHSSIIQYKKVGNNNFIGACSLVTKNLTDNKRIFGIPAKNMIAL